MPHYPDAIRAIIDGWLVNAGSANIPHEDLEARTTYLKALLEGLQAGTALTHPDAPLESSTVVGHAVYWDSVNSQYSRAIATYSVTAGGEVLPDESANALGIVIEKTSSQLGTVAMFGRVNGVDITSVVGSLPTSGVYYLSSTTAGQLTMVRQAITVPIVYLEDGDSFWVSPPFRNSFVEHQHFSFALDTLPAGIVDDPDPGEPYTFVCADSDLPGWLPASHDVFQGLAPAGAEFGYNMALDPSLQSSWPPVPMESARVLVDGIEIPQGDCGLVIVNTAGIWWLRNCYSQAPWDDSGSYSGGSSVPGGCSVPGAAWDVCSSVAGGDCPVVFPKTISLAFSRVTGDTADAFVTRLTGRSPLSFVDCSDGVTEKAYGQLLAIIEPLLTVTGTASDTVVQALTRTAKTVGPNVSGVRGTGLAVITGGAPFTLDDLTYRKGPLTIDVQDSTDHREGSVELIALSDVGEAVYDETQYLRFPATADSSIRCKVNVPAQGLPDTPVMKLEFLILAGGAGDLPDLSFAYRRFEQPTALAPKKAWATPDVALADLSPAAAQLATLAWERILLETATFSIAAGDTVFFTLGRASTDSFASDVGLLRARWIIEPSA